jgi:hypothetical protein
LRLSGHSDGQTIFFFGEQGLTPAATDRDFSNQYLVLDSAGLPDLLEWEYRPSTQMVPEKAVIASPDVGGSNGKPRDIRTWDEVNSMGYAR